MKRITFTQVQDALKRLGIDPTRVTELTLSNGGRDVIWSELAWDEGKDSPRLDEFGQFVHERHYVRAERS